MTNEDMVFKIYLFVRDNGVMTNKAQSCWGADVHEYRGIKVQLCDDGYTQVILWGDRLSCSTTAEHPTVFRKGNEKDLLVLYKGIFE